MRGWRHHGPRPVLPTPRAAIFTAVCLGLGAGAHRVMSDSPIPAWALLIGGIGAYVPARYAAGRGERGLLAIAGLMGVLQVAFHLLFSFAQNAAVPSAASAAMPGMPMPMGMSMPAGTQMPAGTSMRDMPGMSEGVVTSMHMGTGMLLGHALAALVCAFWLWRGEAAVYAVVRGAVFRLPGLWTVMAIAAPPVDRESRTLRIAPRPRTLRSQWLRGTLAQRGPPLLAA